MFLILNGRVAALLKKVKDLDDSEREIVGPTRCNDNVLLIVPKEQLERILGIRETITKIIGHDNQYAERIEVDDVRHVIFTGGLRVESEIDLIDRLRTAGVGVVSANQTSSLQQFLKMDEGRLGLTLKKYAPDLNPDVS